MDTALLRTFRQVAALGSITAAAQVLGYTQSAVSRQIAALEEAFGARLFERGARGVQLTEHGRALQPHADALLARLDDARRELEAIDRLERGRLRVGAFPTAAAALIPRAMSAFRDAHPSVELSLEEGTTRRQLARLQAGDVDVAVISAFPDQLPSRDEVSLVHLLDDTILVALPRAHPLARRRRVRLGDLADQIWIGADDDYFLGPSRLRLASPPRIDFAVREWTAKLGLVAAGLGITLVPSLAAGAARPDIALVRLARDEVPVRAVFAATARGARSSPAAVAFIEELRSAAA
jgi:DNA-binding transcriptional LysR family regulator